MNWATKGKEMLSSCGQYKITNAGKRGGDKYCLYKFDDKYGCHSNLISMGTIDEVKVKADEINV